MPKPATDRPLPAAPDVERLILGALMLDAMQWDAIGTLKVDEFSMDRHRRIYTRMLDLRDRGDAVDYVTTAQELQKHGELESVDGLSYLVSLTDGMPERVALDSYVRIVQEKATLRKAIFACQNVIDRCMVAQEGATDILQSAESVISSLAEPTQKHGDWYVPGQVVEAYPGGVSAFLQPSRGGIGLTTPWKQLDDAICGLQGGDLIVIAGRPSMGKTLIACQIGHHVALNDTCVAMFSLEMSKDALVQRMLAAQALVDLQKLRKNALEPDERARVRRALEEIWDIPFCIDDTRARTISAQQAALRKLNSKRKVGLVIVDHLQLMKGAASARGDQEKLNQVIGEIVHSLKHMAGDFGVPVILLSQLNRECETNDRKPIVPDLKASGDIEQDADIVMFVHRWEQYAKHMHVNNFPCKTCGSPEHRGRADLIIGKQRNGPIGIIPLTFRKGLQRFDVRTEEYRQEEPYGDE